MIAYVTTWAGFRDKRRHRLICDRCSTLDDMSEGYISEQDIQPFQCTACIDADFVGIVETHSTTTCCHLCIEGPNSFFIIPAISNREDSTASATSEADIVATDTVLITLLSPALGIWQVLMGRPRLLGVLKEDNGAEIGVMEPGNTLP